MKTTTTKRLADASPRSNSLIGCLLLCALSLLTAFSSCKESEAEEGEYANWESRNANYFNTLESKYQADPAHWQKLRSYTKEAEAATANTDFIYVYSDNGFDLTDNDRPLTGDSVLIIYQGRLMPTPEHPEGYVFDGVPTSSLSLERGYSSRMFLGTSSSGGSLVDGFYTALLYMHRGDHWQVYIPQQLGYGTTKSSSSSIPSGSTLIFDLILLDYAPANKSLPTWKAPRPSNSQ